MLTPIVNIIVRTLSDLLSGKDISGLTWRIACTIPGVLCLLRQFIAATPEDKLDDALAELDLRTGADKGAIDVLTTLPADKEEQLFDAVKTILRVLIKHALKLPGYHSEPET